MFQSRSGRPPSLYTHSIPNSGSFIRPTAAISYGVSFLSALTAKYIEVPHGTASLEKVVLGSSGGAIEVEAVGLDKIRSKLSRLERLREVSLDNELVSKADPPGKIARTCPGEWPRICTGSLPLSSMVVSTASTARPSVYAGTLFPPVFMVIVMRNTLTLPVHSQGAFTAPSVSVWFVCALSITLNATLRVP